ncbi:hypothetical protein RFI_08224 [Reticulomyxa filosa]|uniref:eIF2D winged helix domain-containing protein n=1 Tax=Reticulomyxa filosa TaxID=46433 RepID=X6NSK6_RETFI|nr:hypothetical protein RFI_08224 [Reticulomyxa filosa]|eukprot:ETO28898.1 hypothetical protein RFI_08224 [Reticulomyxa filosa]
MLSEDKRGILKMPYFYQTTQESDQNDEQVFPTIFLLWQIPYFLPTIFIFSDASEFLLRFLLCSSRATIIRIRTLFLDRLSKKKKKMKQKKLNNSLNFIFKKFTQQGADLMLPGVSWTTHEEMKRVFGQKSKTEWIDEEIKSQSYVQWMPELNLCVCDLEQIETQALVSIQVVGNPLPIGIGQTVMEHVQIVAAQQEAKQSGDDKSAHGKLIHVLHVYRDRLWKFAQTLGKSPPQGFRLNKVESIDVNPVPNIFSLLLEEPSSPQGHLHTAASSSHEKNEEEEKEKQANTTKDNAMRKVKKSQLSHLSMTCNQSFEYCFLVLLLEKWYNQQLPLLASDMYYELQVYENPKKNKGNNNDKKKSFGGFQINKDIKNTEYCKLSRFVKHCEDRSWIKTTQKSSQMFIVSVCPVLDQAVGKYLVGFKYPNFTVPFIDAFFQWCNSNRLDLSQSDFTTDKMPDMLEKWIQSKIGVEEICESAKTDFVEWIGGFETIEIYGAIKTFELALVQEFDLQLVTYLFETL